MSCKNGPNDVLQSNGKCTSVVNYPAETLYGCPDTSYSYNSANHTCSKQVPGTLVPQPGTHCRVGDPAPLAGVCTHTAPPVPAHNTPSCNNGTAPANNQCGRTTLKTAYIYLGGKQIAEVVMGSIGPPSIQFVHTDALGTPVAHTGPSAAGSSAPGTLINRARYEPYGYVAAGTKPSPGTSVIGFTGHVQDAETDLVYMQQRYYDPIAGRFLSVDPVVTDANTGKGFGLYTYVENNPYIYTDPDGREHKVDGTDEFKAKVANDMKWLSSQPAGAELVAQIVSPKTPLVTISETTGGNVTNSTDNKATFNGQPAGAKIEYNPNNSTGPAKDVNGSDQRPPAVGLGHELDHAVGIGKGADKAGLDAKGNKDVAGAKDKSEIRAIRTEQRIRAEHGLPARALTPAQRALDSQMN